MAKKTLADLHRMAVASIGSRAPSLITIKRWSAAGKFQNKSTAESLAMIRDHFAPTPEESHPIAKTEPPAVAQEIPSSNGSLSALETKVADLESAIKKIGEQQEAVIQALNYLNGVKNSLTIKYDGVNAQQSQTIEALKGQIRAMGTDSTVTTELARIRGSLQRIQDNLSSMAR